MATKMTKGLKRLLKLADHLESGKLGHARFDFGAWNARGTKKNPCGTAGCALGECPIAFPRNWTFDVSGVDVKAVTDGITPVLKGGEGNGCDPIESAEAFFDVTNDQANALFMPSDDGEPNRLDSNATAKQVATNIRNFVAAKLNPWSSHV